MQPLDLRIRSVGLDSHRTAWLRHRLAQRTWLSVVHLPRYAPELNPVETMWSQVK
ncbi:transposase, partial [Nocardiopsis rhodophaea]